jgi:hypothetical protein
MITQPSIWGALSDAGSNNVFAFLVNAGAPSNGTSGTGANLAGPGCLLIDSTNKNLYINTNTLASPTWSLVNGSSGGGGVTLTGTQTLTNKTLTAPVITSAVMTFPVQNLTATGTNQATGGAVTLVNSGIVNVSGANTTTGITLAVSVPGSMVAVVNTAAHVLKVYGNATDSATINGTAGTTAYTIAASASSMFIANATAAWQTIPLTSS